MSETVQNIGGAGPAEEQGDAGQLFYPLIDGAVDNWLLAGPHATPLTGPASPTGSGMSIHSKDAQDRFSSLLRAARRAHSFLPYPRSDSERPIRANDPGTLAGWRENAAGAPAERDSFRLGESTLTWRAYRCLEDHFIDLGGFYPTWHYVQAWACAELVCPTAQKAEFVANVCGAAAIWLNGEQLLLQERAGNSRLLTLEAQLLAGHNQVLARLDTVAKGDSPQRFGLSIGGDPGEGWSVCLPTRIAALDRRRKFERFFEDAWLDRYLYTAEDNVEVCWPDAFDRPESTSDSDMELRLQTPNGRIYMMARSPFPKSGEAGARVDMGTARRAPEGPCELQLMPGPEEYAIGGMRLRRRLHLHVSKNRFSDQPAEPGAYAQRRIEALLDATRRQGNFFCEIARMALGRWPQVSVTAVQETITNLMEDAADGACTVVGLLGMLARYGENGSFPVEFTRTLKEKACRFPYWAEGERCRETGDWGESEQILYFAAQVLAGQLFPEREFGSSGATGLQLREEGERSAAAWCQDRGRYGFEEWDSSGMVEANVVALIHLVDFAESDEVRELAAVVLDKIFLGMALNSFRGAYGSTQGRADSLSVRSARIAPSSGISRMLWGMGAFNEHVMGSVSLACSDIYLLPPIIGAIAADQPEAVLNRERHSAAPSAGGEPEPASWEVNKVTYRTPDAMLCSAQDYRPGEPGGQEHIWQATLGPEAVVFVNQPACLSEVEAHQPNCWRGNGRLPRVAQWRDALVAVYNFPDVDGVADLTHAYFPVHAFDEHRLQAGWAFARKGDGYLALTAAQGLTLTERGEQAYRELRSYGRENVWLCQLGRRAEDGDFADFQARALALNVEFTPLAVRFAALRDETLSFGWTGPLCVNGREEAIGGFRQFENPYCTVDLGASQMELIHGEDALRLHFV